MTGDEAYLAPAASGRIRRSIGNVSLGLYRTVVRARDKALSLAWSGAFASFGARSVIQAPLRIRGEARIQIGTGVFIGSGSWLQVEGETQGSLAIEIGDGTSIVGNCVISAAQSVRLGRSVLLAQNVYVADHMHAFEALDQPVLDQGIDRIGPVEIGDGAWLGQNVVVGPGVRIGRGAVIGSNSVVLSDVPDFTIAVGAPARVIRTLPGAAEPHEDA